MKTEMSKLVNASVSYGVDVQNIARIPNLSHEEINEGDTIRIIDEGFTPKLYIEARAIAGDESLKILHKITMYLVIIVKSSIKMMNYVDYTKRY